MHKLLCKNSSLVSKDPVTKYPSYLSSQLFIVYNHIIQEPLEFLPFNAK